MSHCPQWGSDWKAREESATSSVVCSWWDVVLILGKRGAADEAGRVSTTVAATSRSSEVVGGVG